MLKKAAAKGYLEMTNPNMMAPIGNATCKKAPTSGTPRQSSQAVRKRYANEKAAAKRGLEMSNPKLQNARSPLCPPLAMPRARERQRPSLHDNLSSRSQLACRCCEAAQARRRAAALVVMLTSSGLSPLRSVHTPCGLP
eukprot:CAMPEP_0183512332 /NCGR_PEP_ID=MMETSP0371-20130417/11483_1 /TAXON_ID=268820 /ORGANISM="Peridinium aciculiferum, Strain PAER-2" /LENGTH=138 /DNA_ID=CAMNT_0025709389 /DNA_START=72 /DNA_END=484 /DNA_ORIENTATION=+